MKNMAWLLVIFFLVSCDGLRSATAVPLSGSETLITEPIRLELVRVPAGEFLMGGDPLKIPWAGFSMPEHSVYLADFYIGKYEITNEQYSVFVRATGHDAPFYEEEDTPLYHDWESGESWADRWKDGVAPAGREKYPVINVTWDDAVAFTEWLSRETGRKFRLPTEAEWEKACRGTDGRIYPWGDTFDGTKVNFCDENCTQDWRDLSTNDGYRTTAPVDSYPAGASPYGVMNMAGNVVEWTSSLLQKDDSGIFEYPYDPTDGREDQGFNYYRVQRGGHWGISGIYTDCLGRTSGVAWHGFGWLGFRVVVSP